VRKSESAREAHAAVVPRSWLVALIILLVVPWLIAGVLYTRSPRAAAADPASPARGPSPAAAAHGPWGPLVVTPLTISPPLEYVSVDPRSGESPVWSFPASTRSDVEAFLGASGLPPADVARVLATAQVQPRISGLVLSPDPELVRRLDPKVRAFLYGQMAKSTLNFDQAHAFRFFGASTDPWLGSNLISPRTRQLVDPLVYRIGDFLYFADLELVRPQIGDQEELRRLEKLLLRQATVKVELKLEPSADVAALAEYWGRGGRRTDIKPLLESIVGAGSIDIVHLLPTFGRQFLYRYPRVTPADLDRPVIANCLWTALNFFNSVPDDRFLDVNVSIERLKRDYYVIEHGFQLGDVVALLDGENLFHVAVYLADDLVFTKNGTSPMAPWIILPLERVMGYYQTRAAAPRLIYHRRKDL
jgi:hypothetical protein